MHYVGNDFNNVHRILQNDLDAFILWCTGNGPKINSSKTKPMICTTSSRLKQLRAYSFTIMGVDIQYVKQYNYLGLILDSEVTLTPLLKNIKEQVSNKMFALRKLRKYLTCDAAVLVYKQTIMPIFDYAGFLLIGLNNNYKSDLQIMQNDALRFCKGVHLLDKISIENIHNSVKLLSLEQRRQKQLLSIMFIQSIKGK